MDFSTLGFHCRHVPILSWNSNLVRATAILTQSQIALQPFDKMSVRIFGRSPFSSAFFLSSTSAQRVPSIPNKDQVNKHEIDSSISWAVARSRNPENFDSVVSFLKESGFSNTILDHIAKSAPNVLCSNLQQTIKPKFEVFQDLGLSPAQITTVVSGYPRVLTRISETNMERSILMLKKVFGSDFDDERVLKHVGWFLKCDLDKTFMPNLVFLRSCGVPSSQIKVMLYNFPLFLSHKAESLKEIVRRVDEMGVERESKMFVYAIRTIGSMTVEKWEQKLDLFRSLGYSEHDISSMFRSAPNVFAVSDRKIKDTAEFLLSSGRYDSSSILKRPTILICSLERRLKPRLRVLEILDSKKILKFKPSARVYAVSDAEFFERYVNPHLDQVKELSFMVN